ncbi:MAG: OmpA family protein [Chitinophagaceae bacterium]
MKKLLLLLLLFLAFHYSQSQFNIKDKLKSKASQKAEEKTDEAIDKALSKKDKSDKAPSSGNAEEKSSKPEAPAASKDTLAPASTAQSSFKSYQNYDFVPGNKIIFEDDFRSDQDGEFPAHWKLVYGQGVVNNAGGESFFVMTDGNYAKSSPRMKTAAYLGEAFTIEFDYFITDGSEYGIIVFFKPNDDTEDKSVGFRGMGETSTNFPGGGLVAEFKGDQDNYFGKWHHVAIAYKNKQMKLYIDQYRTLVVPDCEFTPTAITFGGIAPLRLKNVRIAEGAGMNMLDKLTTEGKIVTHGITFDVNKATIKPESMGTLNMIVKLMTDKPDLKFEVGGHTDSDGDDAYNLKLSQERAEAVKTQLSKMGIDASRLTSKGFGESKPLNDNNSPENKANNRRVEFTKQ